jgi:hypothetical protein
LQDRLVAGVDAAARSIDLVALHHAEQRPGGPVDQRAAAAAMARLLARETAVGPAAEQRGTAHGDRPAHAIEADRQTLHRQRPARQHRRRRHRADERQRPLSDLDQRQVALLIDGQQAHTRTARYPGRRRRRYIDRDRPEAILALEGVGAAE